MPDFYLPCVDFCRWNSLRRGTKGAISESSVSTIWQPVARMLHPLVRFFPTCQVRVVRFYQSCSPSSPSPSTSPPSPPPPLHPLPGPLLPLPCPLPPCQLFAKLFANFRTQWALLDLNCKGLSAVGTAGPHPGTCRVQ